MSCCISSAVCCVLITSSMSGVALGYNYSLAEYIDMKETNVSVYLKRGIFDDEVSDDMEWRRRGHQPIKGLVRDTGDLKGPDEIPDWSRSGRRLDDTILESDDRNKFEGSLMKLTAKPPHPSTTEAPITSDLEMLQLASSYAPGSLDQLKGVQSLINMRKSMAARDGPAGSPSKSTYGYDEKKLVYLPGSPNAPQSRRIIDMINNPEPVRLEMNEIRYRRPSILMNNQEVPIDHARTAVPRGGEIYPSNWLAPKLSPEVFRKVFGQDRDPPSYPKPVKIDTGPIRPPTYSTQKPSSTRRTTPVHTLEPGVVTPEADIEIEKFKEKLIEEKFGEGLRDEMNDNFLKPRTGEKKAGGSDMEYYDDEIRGLPVRKRRSIGQVKQEKYSYNKKPQILRYRQDYVNNLRDKKTASKSTTESQTKVGAEVPQEINPGRLTKLKVGKSFSNEITDYPSILVSKLHFPYNSQSSQLSVVNEITEKNNASAIKVADFSNSVNNTSSTLNKVIKIIHSMFS